MLGVEESFRGVRENRAVKKDEGMDWRGLTRGDRAFICHVIVLNTADRQLSDSAGKSAARARLCGMNWQWKLHQSGGHQHEDGD